MFVCIIHFLNFPAPCTMHCNTVTVVSDCMRGPGSCRVPASSLTNRIKHCFLHKHHHKEEAGLSSHHSTSLHTTTTTSPHHCHQLSTTTALPHTSCSLPASHLSSPRNVVAAAVAPGCRQSQPPVSPPDPLPAPPPIPPAPPAPPDPPAAAA